MTLLIPDLSEWQGTVNWGALVGAGYPAVIIRAHNGYRIDNQYQRNRPEAARAGVRALGLYQYLVADRDPAQQAAEFIHAIGYLGAGEWPIVDCEAGPFANARIAAWHSTVARALGYDNSWLYTGDSFYRDSALAGAGYPASRTWLAAWGPSEPTTGHVLWQYTDQRTVPGVDVPVDCSTYAGDIGQLLALVSGVRPPAPAPTAPAWPGRYLEILTPEMSGEDVRTWQQRMLERTWTLAVDGVYGPKSAAVCHAFQVEHGLTPDSIVGPATWAASWAAPLS